MNIPFNTQLLGSLIEKGYTYVLASTSLPAAGDGGVTLVLKPMKEKPALTNLPDGFETYYKITREPLQLACGVDGITVEMDYAASNSEVNSNDVYDDGYFRMSEAFFEQVLESLEDYAIFTTDKNGDVNSWNRGAEKVLGYTSQEALGLNAGLFFTPEDIARAADKIELETAMTKGRAIDERYHVRKDRSRFWGSGLVFPLYDEEEHHRGFTKIMRNLRERQNAEEQSAEI